MLYSRKQGYDGTSLIYQHYNKHRLRAFLRMEPVISDNLVDVTFYTQNTLEAVFIFGKIYRNNVNAYEPFYSRND